MFFDATALYQFEAHANEKSTAGWGSIYATVISRVTNEMQILAYFRD